METIFDRAIRLDRVTLRVRDRILFRDTTWEIEPGQHWAVIGPNGAGKTTLVGALTGRVPVVGGKIYRPPRLREDHAIGHVSWERQRRALLQDAARDEARSFCAQPADVLRVRDLFSERRAPAGNDRPIARFWNRSLRSLSSGERRLVFLGRELLKQPRLLVLDEPFTGLDADNRRWLQQMLESAMAARCQLILVTHRTEEIPAGITHVLAVKDGRIHRSGRSAEVLTADYLERLYGQPSPRWSATRPSPPPPAVRGGARLEMRRVTVRYGKRVVLENIDWKIFRHQHWVVAGPNGAGKSTLMQLVAGDHPQAYANEIYWFGRRRGSGETLWEIKRPIGMISAEFQLRYHRPVSAFTVVLSGFFDSVGLYRRTNARQREAAQRWMRQLRIDSLGQRRFDTLSVGEQRRVLLARALVKSPHLLVLDEPCQGLDRSGRADFLKLLDEVVGRNGAVQLLYVTHLPMELPACMTHCLQLVRSANGAMTATAKRLPDG